MDGAHMDSANATAKRQNGKRVASKFGSALASFVILTFEINSK